MMTIAGVALIKKLLSQQFSQMNTLQNKIFTLNFLNTPVTEAFFN